MLDDPEPRFKSFYWYNSLRHQYGFKHRIFWTPARSTIAPGNLSSWVNTEPVRTPTIPGISISILVVQMRMIPDTTLNACKAAPHSEAECKHYHTGNYYNWPAAVASNNTTGYTQAPNSICPKGWRLHTVQKGSDGNASSSEFNELLFAHGIKNYDMTWQFGGGDPVYLGAYLTNGFNNIRQNPLYLVRSGYVYSAYEFEFGESGNYWSASPSNPNLNTIFYLMFNSSNVYPGYGTYGESGKSIRCLAR